MEKITLEMVSKLQNEFNEFIKKGNDLDPLLIMGVNTMAAECYTKDGFLDKNQDDLRKMFVVVLDKMNRHEEAKKFLPPEWQPEFITKDLHFVPFLIKNKECAAHLCAKLHIVELHEQTLQLDLDYFFNALFKGIITTRDPNEKPKILPFEAETLSFVERKDNELEKHYYLTDYGKTWAINRKDLADA